MKTYATVLESKSPLEMTSEELVSYVKTECANPQDGYGVFVKYRGLKPELDAKQFGALWKQIEANRFEATKRIEFHPTHVLPDGRIVMANQTEHGMGWVAQNGATGHDPFRLWKGKPVVTIMTITDRGEMFSIASSFLDSANAIDSFRTSIGEEAAPIRTLSSGELAFFCGENTSFYTRQGVAL